MSFKSTYIGVVPFILSFCCDWVLDLTLSQIPFVGMFLGL